MSSPDGVDSIRGVFVGFGSNQGDRVANWENSLRLLAEHGYEVVRPSPLYESEPWGDAEGGLYLNAVLELVRRGTAQDLLGVMRRIEIHLGRTRLTKYAPRTCDLDLLFWQSAVIATESLVVPHPRIADRRFVLLPLCDLIPNARHPVLNRTLKELLDGCPDSGRVWPYLVSSSHPS